MDSIATTAFNGLISILIAKFILNDMPHMLGQTSSSVYDEEFLSFIANKVATTRYTEISGVNVMEVLERIRTSKPGFAKLLVVYYHIATDRVTPDEVDTAFRIISAENPRLLNRYWQYSRTYPTGVYFAELVGAVKKTGVDIKAADTRSDKVLVVDRFMAVIHEMIVDRWEGYDLSGGTYPLPFDLTNDEAVLYREYLDVLSR